MPSTHILVVEDEPALAEVYRRILTRTTAASVQKAGSLGEALEMIHERSPDIVLLDLGLPDSQGLEGLARIRDRAPGTAVVITTGRDDENSALEALRSGAQDYLLKGNLDVSTLTRSVRYALERKQAEIERERMAAQLRQSQKLQAIGHLAAGIAHEINTPTQYIGDNNAFLMEAFRDLAAVVASHRALLDRLEEADLLPGEREEARRLLEVCDAGFLMEEIPKAIAQTQEGVRRVTRIVGAMKEFSHPGGETKLLTDLNRAIENTVTVCHNEWKYVAELELDLAPGLPLVPCLPGEFNQVVLHLVINAAHAIASAGREGKGTILVRTRLADGRAEIQVRDTGCGIPEEVRAHIFDPFFTTKPVGQGTGQGLSIVHAVVVKRHGGTVAVESEMDRGTTFVLRLPLGEE